jgi:hypothetical protein
MRITRVIQTAYMEYCATCKIHHLRWKTKLFVYEDNFIVNKKKLRGVKNGLI